MHDSKIVGWTYRASHFGAIAAIVVLGEREYKKRSIYEGYVEVDVYDLEEGALDAVCDDGGGMPVEDGGNGGRTRLTAVSGQVAANFELAGYAEDCPGASDARWRMLTFKRDHSVAPISRSFRCGSVG